MVSGAPQLDQGLNGSPTAPVDRGRSEGANP
jgi:hypothetical protein